MKYLYVGATPEVERLAFEAVRGRVTGEFGVAVRELELPAVDFAYDREREQYGSIALLEMLTRLCPPDASKLLAVTEGDLYIPVLTFVFGQAQLNGQVAAVSLARLRQEFYGLPPNHEILVERARKEALHETGHMFGLVHCADRNCAMSLSTNVRQIDLKRDQYCAPCAARLRREARE
jgi:archaemetzincin